VACVGRRMGALREEKAPVVHDDGRQGISRHPPRPVPLPPTTGYGDPRPKMPAAQSAWRVSLQASTLGGINSVLHRDQATHDFLLFPSRKSMEQIG